jgi:predicted transcriptional regulator of viral defense system
MVNKIQYPKGALGRLESNFFALIQMRRMEIVRTGEVAPALGLSRARERDLLRRLARGGWIVRLQRGLYLAPRVLPAGGRWNPPEGVVLPAFMKAIKGRYQISGPTAFNRYGFDGQIPNSVFIYNNRLSGSRHIGSTRYVFIQVADARLGGVEQIKTPNGEELYYSSRARTLVDMLYDWSRFNGIPRGFAWVRQELKVGSVKATDLARAVVRFGNQSTLRRLGWILQRADASPTVLKRIKKALSGSKSPIAMVPSKPRRGPIVKEWGVIDNE